MPTCEHISDEHSKAVAACLAALAKGRVRMAEAKAKETRKPPQATTMNGGPA